MSRAFAQRKRQYDTGGFKTALRSQYEEEEQYKEEQERKRQEEEQARKEQQEQEALARARQNYESAPTTIKQRDVARQQAQERRSYVTDLNFPGSTQQRVFNALDQNPRAQDLQYINNGNTPNARAFQQYLKAGKVLRTPEDLYGEPRNNVPENPYRRETVEDYLGKEKRAREILPEYQYYDVYGDNSEFGAEQWEAIKEAKENLTDEQRKLFDKLRTSSNKAGNHANPSMARQGEQEYQETYQKLLDSGLDEGTIEALRTGTAVRTLKQDLKYSSSELSKLDDQAREYLYQYKDLDDEYEYTRGMSGTGQLDWENGTVVDNKAGRLLTARDAAKAAFMSVTGANEDQFNEYLREATLLRNKRENEEQRGEIWESQHTDDPMTNAWNATRQTLWSNVTQPVAGIPALVDSFKEPVNPEAPTNVYSEAYKPQNLRDDIQSQTGETIAEAVRAKTGDKTAFTNPLTGNDVKWADVAKGGYGAWNSSIEQMIDMAALGPFGEVGTLVPYYTNTYTSSMRQGLERGLTQEQAEALAHIAAATEVGTEEISMEAFVNAAKPNSTLLNSPIGAGAASFFTEGSEEGVSDFINKAAENAILGRNSEYNAGIRGRAEELVAKGASEEEAYKTAEAEAQRQAASEYAESFFWGGVGALGHSGVAYGVSAYRTNQEAQTSLRNADYSAIREANDPSNFTSKAAASMAADARDIASNLEQKEARGETVTDAERYRLYRKIQGAALTEAEYASDGGMSIFSRAKEALRKKTIQERQQKAEQKIVDAYAGKGNSVNAETIASAMWNAQTPEELEKIRRVAENSGEKSVKAVSDSAYQLNKGRIMSERNATQEDFDREAAAPSVTDAFNAGLSGEEVQGKMDTSSRIAYNHGRQVAISRGLRGSVDSDVHSLDVELRSGSSVKLTGRVTYDENGFQIETDQGNISLSDIKDNATRTLFETASKKRDAQEAQTYLENYVPGMAVGKYNQIYKKYTNAGADGEMFEDIDSISEDMKTVPESTLRSIYSYGRYTAGSNFMPHKAEGFTVETMDGEAVELTGRVSGIGKDMVVHTNGKDIKAADIKSPGARDLFLTAAEMGTTEAAQLFIDSYVEGTPIARYTQTFRKYYVLGAIGKDYNSIDAGPAAKWMPETTRKAIYKFGASEAEVQKNENRENERKTVRTRGEGKIIDTRENKTSLPEMPILEALARTGINIRIGGNADNGDNGSAINGSLNSAIQELFLNADKDSGLRLNTIFHEAFGELLHAFNAEGAERIQNEIARYLAEDENFMAQLLEVYQRPYIDVEGKKRAYDVVSEIVNDSIAGLFSTREGIRDFSNWLQSKYSPEKSTGILRRTSNYFKGIADAFHRILSGNSLSLAARRTARMAESRAREIRKMILQEMDVAIENARKAGIDPNAESGQAYSVKTLELSAKDLNNNLNTVRGMEATDVDFTDLKNLGAESLNIDAVKRLAKEEGWDTIFRDDVGDIAVTNDGLRLLLGHHMDRNLKIIRGVPAVLKNGAIVAADHNHKGKGYNTVTIVAPVNFRGTGYKKVGAGEYYVGVVLERRIQPNNASQKYHAINLLAIKKEPSNLVSPSLQAGQLSDGVAPDLYEILQHVAAGVNIYADSDVKRRYSVNVDSAGNTLSDAQAEFFKDSKVRDENGNLKVMFHGTQNDFNIFDFSQGGKNGTAEGFGIYLSDNKDVSSAYGGRIVESYVNMTRPARSDARTITRRELSSLIKQTVRNAAQEMAEDYDGDIAAASKDTWISNYTYTYDKSLDASIRDVADQILRMNSDDMAIVQEVMAGMSIMDYDAASKFYDLLTDITGIDGFITSWTNHEDGSESEIALAFRSNQIKNITNQSPTNNPDIRYSINAAMEDIYGDNVQIETDQNGEFQLATAEGSDTIIFNDASIRHSLMTLDNTQNKLAKYLKSKGHDQEDIDTTLGMVQSMAQLLEDVSHGYKEMDEALHTDVIYDITGTRQVLRSLLKNGEYPVNFDFMTICKKRQAYMRVLTDLIDDGTFEAVNYNPMAIAAVNDILRNNGYETACLACFVESRRLQIQKWSETFCEAWNRQVEKVAGKNALPFDFGKNARGTTSYSQEEIQKLAEEFDNGGKKNDKGNLNLGTGAVEEKMGRLLEKMPTLARTIQPGDILKTNGVANLRGHYGEIYSLLLQWYGSNTPKVNQDFNPYNGEVTDLAYSFMKKATGDPLVGSKKYKAWAKKQVESELGHALSKKENSKFSKEIEERAIRKYLYDIGGARLQSFSDFLIENSLDYFQMIADLSARQFPLHAYSKEISFNRLFGMTGMKLNMSLIPVVNRAAGEAMAGLNPDGSYAGWGDFERHKMMKGNSFIQSIGWKDALALQLDPRYSKNIGTIAIGISDAHIRKMLSDPLIRMVIPYHSSGMNPDYAKKMNVDYYTDYTDFQNTKVKQYYDLDGNEVSGFGDKAKPDMSWNFNEAAQRLGDARAAAQEYIEWCGKRHPVYKSGKKVGEAVFTPKFEQFSTGEGSENYYKLLEDFNMYDAITEEYAPQQGVQMRFPDTSNQLSAQELQEYADRLRATGEFTEKDIQKYVDRASMTMEDIIRKEAADRNTYRRNADKNYDKTYKEITDMLNEQYSREAVMNSGEDLRNSVSVTDPETIKFLENQDHITTYRTFQMIDGGLYAPMNAMENGKLGFRSEIGKWEQATEDSSKVKDGKFPLKAGGYTASGKARTTWAAYNPYLHSSNLVFNDQFTAAYDRPNLVVVECEVPISETTSGYHADQAKDPVGWLEWKSGSVANALKKKGLERKVMLSRWMKPVRVLSNQEVAQIYKDSLDGTGIVVPWNVVSPPLRQELEKLGVDIDYGYQSAVKASFEDKFPGERHSVVVDDFFGDSYGMEDSYTQMTLAGAGSILEDGAKALKGKTVDEKLIRGIASELRNKYGSTYDLNTFAENLRKVFAYAQGSDSVDYNDLMNLVREVAQPVIDEATQKVGQEEYDAFLAAIGNQKIRLTDRQKDAVREIFGSYPNFQRAMRGIRINDNGDVTLDQIWNELVESVPGVLDYDVTEGDMPLNLYDALATLKPTVRNMYGENNEEAAADLAMEIVEQYYEQAGRATGNEAAKAAAQRMREQGKQYRERVRERYNERLKEAKERLKEQRKQYGEKVRADRDQKIAEMRAKNRQRAVDIKERREAARQRDMVNSSARKLMQWAYDPNDQHHIPKSMLAPVAEFLSALDFVDPHVTQNKKTGKWVVRILNHTVRNSNGDFVRNEFDTVEADSRAEAVRKYKEMLGRGLGSRAAKSWQQRMQVLQDLLENIKNEQTESRDLDDITSILDKDLADELRDLLQRNRDVLSVSNLNAADLKILNKVLRGITHAINVGNKAFMSNDNIRDLAEDTMTMAKNDRVRRKDHSAGINKILDNITLDMATPLTYFKMLGEGGHKVYKGLRQALNTKVADIRTAQEYFEEQVGKDAAKQIQKWTGKKAEIHEFQTVDGTIRMTTAQIMSLYELSKRQQAMLHTVGGFTPSTLTVNKKEVSQPVMHLTEDMIREITDTLTPEQKRIADALQQFMANQCSDWGNEAALTMYGYEKFSDPNYFPISVDKNTVSVNNSTAATGLINAIKNSGFTKQVTPNANNPLVVHDIFDVFTNHVTDMATYHGFAPAITDALRWFNYRTVDTDEQTSFNYRQTVQGAVEAIYGQRGGKQYFVKLIGDLNQMEKSSYISNGMVDTLVSHYKVAAVGGNLRVVIQQPTAYARALNTINGKYLLRAMAASPKAVMDRAAAAKDQNMIAWWKGQGYYETAIGKSMKEMITGATTTMDKIRNLSTAAAGAADDVTWGALYRAVELEQADIFRREGNSTDSEEYRQAVNDRFDDLVDETQVVDATLLRSQYMRSQDMLNKLQTAFMAEPMKSYNMLLQSAMTSMREKNAKPIVKSAVVFTATSVLTALAAGLVDAFRRDDDETSWFERWLKASGANFGDNINPLGLMPVIKDFADTAVSIIAGETTFASSSARMDIDAVNNMLSAAQKTVKYFNRIRSGEGPKANEATLYGVVKTDLKALSQLTGVPLYALWRDLGENLINAFGYNLQTNYKPYDRLHYAINTGEFDVKEEVDTILDSGRDKGDISTSLKKKYGEALIDTQGTPEGDELRQDIFDALVEAGYEEDKANAKIESWINPDAEEESGGEEYVSEYQGVYDAIDSGSDPAAAVQELLSAGKKASSVKTTITRRYKDDMIQVYGSGDMKAASALKQQLIVAYMAAGMTRDEANNKINEWLGL